MGAPLSLDHAVLRVEDLAPGRADFTALGFTVIAGDEHPLLGSHNDLIAFADGSYLELISLRK